MTETDTYAASGREKRVTKSITFSASPADQRFLAALETLVATGCYESFSDLCKQALRAMLFLVEGKGAAVATASLEQEVRDLQLKVAALEGQLFSLQAGAAGQRAIALEPANGLSAPQPASARSPADPLLQRLGPLLEDF